MPEKKLSGKKVAILATDGFEEAELFEPREALIEAGAKVDLVSLKEGEIKAWKKDNWGKKINVDVPLGNARPIFMMHFYFQVG